MNRTLLSILFLVSLLLPFCAYAEVYEEFRNFLSIKDESQYRPVFVVAGALLAAATFFKPRFGLVVMLLFIMISTDMPIGRNATVGRSITIRVEDIILLLVSAGWLLNKARTHTLSLVKRCPLYLPVFAMALVIVIATLVGYLQGTVPAMKGFFFAMKRLEYFWIFFMTFNILETDKEAQVSTQILFVVSGIIAIFGIGQYYLFPVSALTGGGATALTGFGRANTFGDFLLILIGLASGFLICLRSARWTPVFNGLLALFLFALLMTKSRGAYVSVPPLILVISAVSRSRKFLYLLASFVVLIVCYFLVASILSGDALMLLKMHNNDISEQFTQIADVATEGAQVDPSLRSRVDSWRGSIDDILKYPFFGQGCGSKNLGYSDNQYFTEVLDTGVIGLSTFLYMNFMIFVFMWRYYLIATDLYPRAMTLGFMGGHAGMMVHGVTMSNFYTIFNMEVFWFVVALICVFFHNECKRREETAEELQPSDSPIRS